MKSRLIKTISKDDGRTVALVGLGRAGDPIAMIYLDDFEFLMQLGITANWTCMPVGNYVTCNSYNNSGSKLQVARVLLDAGPGTSVRYVDGNPLNLRRENLTVVASRKAIRRDRDFVPRKRPDLREAA